MKERYLNPLTDFGFKKLFGSEPNKFLLIDFLNQLLPKYHQIKDLTYTKDEHLGSSPDDRKAIFDLFCESEEGNKFIVEIQRAHQPFFLDRNIFYSTFPIQEQAKRGDWDYKLRPVYFIAILDFNIVNLELGKDFLHEVQLKDKQNRVLYDKLTYTYIELPKFTKTQEELETKFDKWLYVFKHLAKLDDRPQKLQDRVFERLFEAAEIAKMSKGEQIKHEAAQKSYLDWKNVLSGAESKGHEQGLEQGVEQGRDERSIEIAKGMKQKGMTVELIIELTGLSVKEVEKL